MSKYTEINPTEDKALGFLWKTGTYTYKSSNGVEVTVSDTQDVQILENKETGEVLVVGAKGASISSGSKSSAITVYESEVDLIDTGKGNDNIKVYNSTVDKIDTGRGVDNITIEDSTVKNKINTGSGNDYVTVTDSTIDSLNTSSKFLWGIFDDGEDTVVLNDTTSAKVQTGRGDDNVIVENSKVDSLKTGSGKDAISTDKETKIAKSDTAKKDVTVEDKKYLDIDSKVLTDLVKGVEVPLDDGTNLELSEYTEYVLNQPTGFETQEEYEQYTLDTLTSELEAMKTAFQGQKDKDGIIAEGYSGLKELTGLGISADDVDEMLARQEEMINALSAAKAGKSNMSFEETFKHYTGVDFSQEKMDNYLNASKTYSAIMIGMQSDEDYADKFEEATGKSIEDVQKELALAKTDALGNDTALQNLVDKYSEDQNSFADKLSTVVSIAGLTCIVVGAVATFIPGGQAIGLGLMTAGKHVAFAGMFADNAIDLVDDTTDKDGLTQEEFKDLALETGVEAVSYAAGRGIGKMTNGLNNVVTQKAVDAGLGKTGSYIAGQAAETITDTALSLGADYAIAQGQSLITTGQFMKAEDYWSMDRFLGEGKNQLIGILTGLASSKVSSFQQGIYAAAGTKLQTQDIASVKQYMRSQGLNDTQINNFFKGVDIENCASHSNIDSSQNQKLTKMIQDGNISQQDADTYARYGLSDSQIDTAQKLMAEGATAQEASICANYGISNKAYQDARALVDNNPDMDFANAANIVKNSDVFKLLNSGELTLEDASIYAARGFTTKQVAAAKEFKNKHPEANTSQAAIISSNKTINQLFESGKISSIEDATIYSEYGLSKAQVENAQKLQQEEGLATSAASILARNTLVYNMYKNGEIDSLQNAIKYAQDCKYKEDVLKAMGEKPQDTTNSETDKVKPDGDTQEPENGEVKPESDEVKSEDGEVKSEDSQKVDKTTQSEAQDTKTQEKIKQTIESLRAKASYIENKTFTIDGKSAEFEILQGTQGGSNKGYYVVNKETGELFYAKEAGTSNQCNVEMAANLLYKAAGIEVPEMKFFEGSDGTKGILSKYIPDLEAPKTTSGAITEGFGMDVLLANWDAIGLNNDNTLVSADGKHAVKIDAGGSFDYRAQSANKPYTTVPMELITMLDSSINPQAAKMFGNMTRTDLISSLEKVANLSESDIKTALGSTKCDIYTDRVLARQEFIKTLIGEMSATPQKSGESSLDYMKRMTSATIDKTISNATTQAELDDLKQAVVSMKCHTNDDIALKKQLLSNISQKATTISQPKITNLSTADVENMLLQSGFSKGSGGQIKRMQNVSGSAFDQQLSSYAATKLKIPLSTQDVECIKTMINEAAKVSDISSIDMEKVVVLYQNLKQGSSDIFNHGSPNCIGSNFKYMTPQKWAAILNIAQQKAITGDQYSAFESYKSSSTAINNALTDYAEHGTPIPSGLQKQIDAMQTYIDTQTLDQTIHLTRGEGYYGSGNPYGCLKTVTLPDGRTLDEALSQALSAAKNSKGDIVDMAPIHAIEDLVNDPNATYTATNERFTSTNFASDSHSSSLVWDLTVQKGSKGVFLEGNNFTDTLSSECEFLLQKDSHFEITDIRYDTTKKAWIVSANVTN